MKGCTFPNVQLCSRDSLSQELRNLILLQVDSISATLEALSAVDVERRMVANLAWPFMAYRSPFPA